MEKKDAKLGKPLEAWGIKKTRSPVTPALYVGFRAESEGGRSTNKTGNMNYTILTAPCGMDCFNCPLFAENAQTSERLALNSLRPELADIQCKGCRAQNCVLLPQPCPTRQCVKDRKVDFCHECVDFPCQRLAPMADQAQKVPHNLKLFNLCRIKAIGVEPWARNEARLIRDRYFKGQFKIGSGPQMH